MTTQELLLRARGAKDAMAMASLAPRARSSSSCVVIEIISLNFHVDK